MIQGAGLALLGGSARMLQKNQRVSLGTLLGQILSSLFAGLVVFLALKGRTELDEALRLAVTGLGGYAGVDLLAQLNAWIVQKARDFNGKGDHHGDL